MVFLTPHLLLSRCPHCQIDNPNLISVLRQGQTGVEYFGTVDHQGAATRIWKVYKCSRCGGAILAGGAVGVQLNNVHSHVNINQTEATEIYPKPTQVDVSLPPTAKEYLTQAINSIHAPAGSVMLCASSVDAMLKDKGYTTGNLYTRINKAADDHLITVGMKEWAHEIRLDANDQRHADQAALLPTTADAQKNIEFAQALGQFLYALPARIAQGRAIAQASSTVQSLPLSSTAPAGSPIR